RGIRAAVPDSGPRRLPSRQQGLLSGGRRLGEPQRLRSQDWQRCRRSGWLAATVNLWTGLIRCSLPGETMRKISFAVLLLQLLIPAAAPAWAAPKTADEWYEDGANQYTLGNFDKAIDAFKQGFSLEPDESKKANYLYNIAQAYRQTHDCKNAL